MPAELVLRSRSSSNTCERMQRVERTAAFGWSALTRSRRRSAPGSWSWQGQSWGQRGSRNSKRDVYLPFSRGEVAERLKAAVC